MLTKDTTDYLAWDGPLAIDADGAPNAYGPKGSSPAGLDYLANAGTPAAPAVMGTDELGKPKVLQAAVAANWYGILTDTGRPDGRPIIQKMSDPCPGMYISPTSLVDKGYAATDPRRYVDSTQVPYLAAPRDAIKDRGIKLGDVGFAYNRVTQLFCAAVVADVGPKGKYGEGSIALAHALGIPNTSPKNGGAEKDIVVVVFKNSGKGWPRPAAEINDQVGQLVTAHGGLDKLL